MPPEICPSCGTPYDDDATFCINCGAKKTPPEKPSQSQPPAEAIAPAEPAPPGPGPIESPAQPEPPGAPQMPVEPRPVPEPRPVKKPAPEEDVLRRLDQKTEEAPPPVQPKKKSKKGCCIAAVIIALIIGLIGACLLVVYFTDIGSSLGGLFGSQGYTNDFSTASADELKPIAKGKGAVVASENGMLKVRNALVVVNHNPGADYTASCRLVFQSVDGKSGWAGLALRVTPQADRYAFELLPKGNKVRIEKIPGAGKPATLASKYVGGLALGKTLDVSATVAGEDLTLKIGDTAVCKTTYIGLAAGPMGLEARGATAYFDDLNITSE